jgi:hypothetical protein
VSPSAEQVLPSFPPREILPGEVLERGTVDEVIEASPGSDVPDDQDALPVSGASASVTSPARGSLDAVAAE